LFSFSTGDNHEPQEKNAGTHRRPGTGWFCQLRKRPGNLLAFRGVQGLSTPVLAGRKTRRRPGRPRSFKVKVTFEGPETEQQVDKQIDMLSAALAKKPAAIGFAALDSKAAIPLLEKAQAAKIPVIAFDSGVASDIVLTTAQTDSKAAAALAADMMAKQIGGEGEVAVDRRTTRPAPPAPTGAMALSTRSKPSTPRSRSWTSSTAVATT